MPAEAEIRAWVRRVALDDDHAAFNQLVREHQSAVRRFLRRLTRPDEAWADDLAQETFLKAYQHIDSFRGDGRFLSWLFQIAYQSYVAALRRRKPEDLVTTVPETAGNRPDPAAGLTVARLLHDLAPAVRAALVLHYQFGLTHAEIADTTDQPLGTVKSQLRRALEQLRQTHGKRGVRV